MPETYSPGWYPDPTGAEPYWWWNGGSRPAAVRANPRCTGRMRGVRREPSPSRWMLLACVVLLLAAVVGMVAVVTIS